MSGGSDHHGEMFPPGALDETAIEAFLSGRATSAGELGPLAAFAEDVRMAVDRPVPVPTAGLARLMTDGISTPSGVTRAEPAHRRGARAADSSKRRKTVLISELLAGLVAKLTGLGMAAKAALGMGVAAASVTGAGAANLLPDPAQHAVSTAVSAATPFELPDGDDTESGGGVEGTDQVSDDAADPSGRAVNHGACVSAVAKNAPRGAGGVHGEAVSAAARSDCGKISSSSTTTSSISPTTTSLATTTTTIDEETLTADDNRGRGGPGRGGGQGNGNSGNSGPGNSGNGNGGNSGPGGGQGPGKSGK